MSETKEIPPLKVGDTIDFGDDGTGTITARDLNRVFLESQVLTGWVDEEWLRSALQWRTND